MVFIEALFRHMTKLILIGHYKMILMVLLDKVNHRMNPEFTENMCGYTLSMNYKIASRVLENKSENWELEGVNVGNSGVDYLTT